MVLRHLKRADVATTLQPHQQRVVSRIQQPDQPGLVVAHGLGSGKTLSAIAAQEALGMPASVVTPAALRANFAKEQLKHLTGKTQLTEMLSLEQVARSGAKPKAPLLIVDEAHRARDPSTRTFKALQGAEAQKRLFLTGSPFYNHPADIAPLVNLAAGNQVLPQQRSEFSRRYVAERKISPGLLDRLFHGVKPGVEEGLNPVRKKELAGHLQKWVDYHPTTREGYPEAIHEDVRVPMDPEQLQVYDAVLKRAPPWVSRKVRSGLPPSKQESKELNAFLGAVRQVANTTRAFQTGGKPHEPKIHAAFSELQKTLGADETSKAVVYSNYLSSGIEPYKEKLEAAGIPYGEFTGRMDRAERNQMVKDYNEGRLRVLLLSSAGGEGLDLKGTRLMQLLDRHWNDEKMRQVVGRGIRFQSHEHLPPEQRNVRVQHFYATRPPRGILERIHLKEPGKAVDEYLHIVSENKDHLINEFRALLEEQDLQAREANKAASVRPKDVLLGAALASGAVLTAYDAYKARGLSKEVAELKGVIGGEHKDSVNVVAYMKERDPTVEIVNTREKVDKFVKEEFHGRPLWAFLARSGLRAQVDVGDNASAYVGKRAYIIGRGKMHPDIIEHEYGHIQDFREKGIDFTKGTMGEYQRGFLHGLHQLFSKDEYVKGRFDAEVKAWEKAKESPTKAEHQRRALQTYDKAFHFTRGMVVGSTVAHVGAHLLLQHLPRG